MIGILQWAQSRSFKYKNLRTWHFPKSYSKSFLAIIHITNFICYLRGIIDLATVSQCHNILFAQLYCNTNSFHLCSVPALMLFKHFSTADVILPLHVSACHTINYSISYACEWFYKVHVIAIIYNLLDVASSMVILAFMEYWEIFYAIRSLNFTQMHCYKLCGNENFCNTLIG